MSVAACPECGQDFDDHPTRPEWPGERRLRNHMAQASHTGEPIIVGPSDVVVVPPPPDDPPDPDDAAAGDPGPSVADAPQAPAVATDEAPPAPAHPGGVGRQAAPEPPRRRGLLDRFRGADRGPRAPKAPKPPKPPRPERPAAPRGRRLSAAEGIAGILGYGGNALQRTGHVPTGRMVTFQAPVTGEIVDDLLAGTVVDRVALQRIARGKGLVDKLGAVFLPTLLTYRLEVAMASGDQRLFEQTQALLRESIRDALPIMLPAMKKQRDRERKTNAAVAELLDEDDLRELGIRIQDGQPVDAETGDRVDVADVFVEMLFKDWTTAAPPRRATVIYDVQPQPGHEPTEESVP